MISLLIDFFVIDDNNDDNDGGEAGMDEELTGEFFVSNGENLSDLSEHWSIASHATDGKQTAHYT